MSAMDGEDLDAAQMEEMKRVILNKILTKEAHERLGRLRLVKPDLAAQLELYLVQVYQSGKVEGQISDEQMKAILEMLNPARKFTIKRK